MKRREASVSNSVEDLLHGRVSVDDMRKRVTRDVEVARKRLDRLTRRRPVLACGVALAAGYVAGRLVTRW